MKNDNTDKILYKDIKKVIPKDIAKHFVIVSDTRPVLKEQSKNQKLTSEHLLVYRFEHENGSLDYAVIGAVEKMAARRIAEGTIYYDWLKAIYTLINTDPRTMKGAEEHEYKQANYIFQNHNYIGMRDFDFEDRRGSYFRFTQEGFDLINGKQYYLNDGIVQRTVAVEGNEIYDNQLAIGRKYDTNNNLFSRVAEVPFKKWHFYAKHYFLNQSELHRMTPEEATEYVFAHFDRLMFILARDGRKDNKNAYEKLSGFNNFYLKMKQVNPDYKIRNIKGLDDYIAKLLFGVDGVLRGENPFNEFTVQDKEAIRKQGI